MRQTTSATSGPFHGKPASIRGGTGVTPIAACRVAEGVQRVLGRLHVPLRDLLLGRDGPLAIRRPLGASSLSLS
jgi:hypothetical protein